jgi:hypothetical protein
MEQETTKLIDIILEDEPKEWMKAIFPRWLDRMRAYGKLVIVPTFKHPLEAFPIFDLPQEEIDHPEPMSQVTRSVIEWGLEGDRIAPEFRQHFQSVLLIESPFEEIPE